MDITNLTVTELLEKIRKQEVTSFEVVNKYLDNISAREGSINAFMQIFREGALIQAKEVDEKIKNGKRVIATFSCFC